MFKKGQKAWNKGKEKKDTSLVGKKFGMLLVLDYSHSDIKHSFLKCKCDCGKTTTVRSNSLVSGITKSCGCLQRKHAKQLKIKPFGESTKTEAWGNFNRGAKTRKYINKLTFKEWCELSKQDCFYCGEEPSNNQKSHFDNGDFVYNGIDRLKNNIGYEIGNVVSCCYKCNKMKMVLDDNDFIKQVEKIYKFLNNKNI